MARRTRLLTTWLMYLVVGSMTSANPTPLKLRWNTDTYGCSKGEDCNPLGPDGPWQAIAMTAINHTTSSKNGAESISGWTGFYPSSDGGLDILADTAGGPYHHSGNSNNKSLAPTSHLHDDNGSSKNMTQYTDSFRLATPVAQFSVSVAVNAITAWHWALPNGTRYTPHWGRFGLSPPGPLDQLKSGGQISSRFFGLHMGSAALHQAASLTLGGYEQNRVVGPVGSFHNDLFTSRVQGRVFLIDVVLGVQEGASPFQDESITAENPLSVWRGPRGNDLGASYTRRLGGADGSAVVRLDPNEPYMNFPIENCKAMAEKLPVSWRDDIKYWLWNTTDPAYTRLISSPAYLGFVFSDQSAKNLTIKVPFALLNLTLTQPIMSQPTAYFPCMTTNFTGPVWNLGRAFLQAAFFAMDFDTDMTYLAQAPGPSDQDQSVFQTVEAGNTSIQSSPIEVFAQSWRSHWTTTTKTIAPDQSSSDAQKSKRLSGGAIAAVVVVSHAVLVLVVGLAVCIWRKRRGRGIETLATAGTGQKRIEKDSVGITPEMAGQEIAHKMAVPAARHQTSEGDVPAELPGHSMSFDGATEGNDAAELPGHSTSFDGATEVLLCR